MSDTSIQLDDQGFPVMMAEPDAAPPSRRQGSGEGVGPARPAPTPSARPSTVAHDEWARRQDAVRDAAREFEDLSTQDIRERLRGLTSKPLSDEDLEQFRVDVRAAAMDDLVDVLDQNARGKDRGRRTVKVKAPRGYTRKIINSLDDQEREAVRARLLARGLTKKQLDGVLPKVESTPKPELPDPGAPSRT
jgi:hypothetical protein